MAGTRRWPIWFGRSACGCLAGVLIAGNACAQALDATDDPTDPPDFSVLAEATPEIPIRRLESPSPSGVPSAMVGNRTEKLDGSVSGSAGQRLPTAWDTKVGVDFGLAAPATLWRPDTLIPGQVPRDRGTGWANVTVPDALGWDKATIDARLDPNDDQGRVSTSLSRSVAVGGGMSLTVQNGYAVTRSLASPNAVPPTPNAAASPGASHAFAGDGALRLELPTATAFSAGARMSTTDDKLLRSLSAEQRLFDTPLRITGSISERPDGEPDRSITAGFRHTW